MDNLFFEMLRVSLGSRGGLSRVPSASDWERLYELAKEQAIVGILFEGLQWCMVHNEWCMVNLPLNLKLQWIGEVQIIQQCNREMDEAVVALCSEMVSECIQTLVFKGQALAGIYPDRTLRQSGDIDFYVKKNDWERALNWLKQRVENGEIDCYEDNTAIKDIQYKCRGTAYEMHRMLVSFSTQKHLNYWENEVVPLIWNNVAHVKISGYDIPTLPHEINILYVFVHIFEHLISDGVGLKQFVDWYYLIEIASQARNEESVKVLEKHLRGVGLLKAYSGLGAILTDYLGLPEEKFPFAISEEDHRQAPKLMKNILKMGNFGHNVEYMQNKGVIHGIQHLGRVYRQARLFGHYAPAEAWWKLFGFFPWWVKKLWRMVT